MESRSQESTSCPFLRPAFHSQLQFDDLLIQQNELFPDNLIGMVVSKKLVSEPAPLGDLIEEIRQGIGLIKSAAQLVLHTGGAAVGDDVVHLPAVLSQVGPCGLVLLLVGSSAAHQD